MGIYKDYIESISKIEHAIKMQREGKSEYLSIEKGRRDFISSCWYCIGNGIREGYNEIISDIDTDIKVPELTDDQVRIMTRNVIIQGCHSEGIEKEVLKDVFDLTDNELERIISEI